MKNVFRNIIITLLVCKILSPSSIYSNENNWQVEIELEKQTYVLHEPIWLDVNLFNSASETLRTQGLSDPNQSQFIIEFKDSIGGTVEYTGPQYLMVADSGKLFLEPGENDYGSFDLLDFFGSFEEKSGYSVLVTRFHFIPKGAYTIRVLFEDNFSNELTFNIEEPFGEEKQALELIEEASKIWTSNNTDTSAQIFQEIVDKFPNSVFVEKCYYLSRFYLQKNRDKRKQGLFDYRTFYIEFLENYPNSGNSKSWLLSITRDLDDDQKLKIFNKYIEDYPNTRCFKFAQQMKNRILKKKGGK